MRRRTGVGRRKTGAGRRKTGAGGRRTSAITAGRERMRPHLAAAIT